MYNEQNKFLYKIQPNLASEIIQTEGRFQALSEIKIDDESKDNNLFQANALFLYPLKTSENQRFSDVFRGYRNRTLA